MRHPGWIRFVVWQGREETQEIHDRYRPYWSEGRENLMHVPKAWECQRCGDLAAFSVLDLDGPPDREQFEQDLEELRAFLDATQHHAHQEPRRWAVTTPATDQEPSQPDDKG